MAERTAELRALAAELTQSEDRERRRIAEILHDSLQQLLVGARIHLGVALGQSDPEARSQSLEKAIRILEESTAISRELSHELSPPVLYDFGLHESLDWLANWMSQKHGLVVEVQTQDGLGTRLPEDITLLLFHSVRELLFNVVKHAGVQRANVHLCCPANDAIEVRVSDQGSGSKQTGFAHLGSPVAGSAFSGSGSGFSGSVDEWTWRALRAWERRSASLPRLRRTRTDSELDRAPQPSEDSLKRLNRCSFVQFLLENEKGPADILFSLSSKNQSDLFYFGTTLFAKIRLHFASIFGC